MVNRKKVIKIISVLLLFIWIIVIFLFSAETGRTSLSKSKDLLQSIIDMTNFHFLSVYIIRKIAHFLEYLILGFLLLMTISKFKPLNKKIILVSIFLCVLYACTDEMHQLFVPGRDGRIFDVFVDTMGILLGVTIYRLLRREKFENNNK